MKVEKSELHNNFSLEKELYLHQPSPNDVLRSTFLLPLTVTIKSYF